MLPAYRSAAVEVILIGMASARDTLRKIIHIDMDAFYAAVEQLDRPELRNRPVIVGGDPASRGVVATASYEARAYGIHSAMPASRARHLCSKAIFLPPRFERYREISAAIHVVLRGYSNVIEPLSLDEAYLDVTGSRCLQGSATRLAQAIRKEIRARTGLVASAGVSYNKCLAKLASDLDKPDGLSVITPAEGPDFIAALAIERLPGIGPATQRQLCRLGIATGADLRRRSLEDLVEHFGKAGAWYYQIARGIDDRPVTPHRERKSLGCERTFPVDLRHREELLAALSTLADRLAVGLADHGLAAHTLTLKLKYSDFRLLTRSFSTPLPFHTRAEIDARLPALLERCGVGPHAPVRLLGLSASRFTPLRAITALQASLPLVP